MLRQRSLSPILQVFHALLIALPEFCALGINAFEKDIYGRFNVLGGAASRGLFDIIHKVTRQIGIKASQVAVPRRALDFLNKIRRQITARSTLALLSFLRPRCLALGQLRIRVLSPELSEITCSTLVLASSILIFVTFALDLRHSHILHLYWDYLQAPRMPLPLRHAAWRLHLFSQLPCLFKAPRRLGAARCLRLFSFGFANLPPCSVTSSSSCPVASKPSGTPQAYVTAFLARYSFSSPARRRTYCSSSGSAWLWPRSLDPSDSAD
jgi:hypothetical protein